MCLCYCRNGNIVATCKGAPRMKYKYLSRETFPDVFVVVVKIVGGRGVWGGGGRRLAFSSLRENR